MKKVHKEAVPLILSRYCIYQKEVQGVLDCTVSQRLIHLRPFVTTLRELRAPSKIKNLSPDFVHRYVLKNAFRFSRKYQKEFLCALRSFFKFLLFYGLTEVRLMEALPKLPTWQLSEVPRGIPWTDVQKLLSMPKRHLKNGKRNYALLLLLSNYGVRYAQARRLKLEDIRWRNGVIHFASCKGGRPLKFPLYENVASALLDYIKNGRPQCSIEEVFIQDRCSEPMPLRQSALLSTLKIYYKRAGIDSQGKGFHAIRHAFATKLTEEETPIKNISDILGHRSIKSTLIYTKIDLPQLRRFCREWPEVAS